MKQIQKLDSEWRYFHYTHYYCPQAAPPPNYAFESVNLSSDNALSLEAKRKINLFFQTYRLMTPGECEK